jgi:hypothetical protein
MEAEQQTLEHRVDFATIELKLTEEYKAQLSSPAPSVASQLLRQRLPQCLREPARFILFLAEAAPTPLLWLTFLSVPVWLFWRRYRRSLAMR